MKQLVHLQTFLLVSKTGSLTQAAENLHISVGAVSHRLKTLEEGIGSPLLIKKRGGMTLTPMGESLRTKVEGHIGALENVMENLNSTHTPFTVSVMPWLASSWLMPRLHRFYAQNPGDSIRIETSSRLANLAEGEASAGLRFGRGIWPNISAEWLFDEWVTPMARPDLIESAQLKSKDPRAWPLLSDPDGLWTHWFSDYYETFDFKENLYINTVPSIDLQDANTLAEAACTGLGVILGRFTQTYSLLRDNKLCALSTDWLQSPKSHYLVRDHRKAPHPTFEKFHQWLKKEIDLDRERVNFVKNA